MLLGPASNNAVDLVHTFPFFFVGISDLLDEYICYSNKEYALARKQSRIDKFRVYELRTGSFETYKNYLIHEKSNRTSKVEYETPRKLVDFYDINLLFNLRLD
jgi:hypothetical protein